MQRRTTLPNGVTLRVVDDVVEYVGPRNVERIFGISENRAPMFAAAARSKWSPCAVPA